MANPHCDICNECEFESVEDTKEYADKIKAIVSYAQARQISCREALADINDVIGRNVSLFFAS